MTRLEEPCGRALSASPVPSYTLIKKLWVGWQSADPAHATLLDADKSMRKHFADIE